MLHDDKTNENGLESNKNDDMTSGPKKDENVAQNVNTVDLTDVKDAAPELTDRNWEFLKYIEEGYKVKDAYKMAGYEGNNPNTPYVFYNKIKKKLIAVQEADSLDGLRLRNKLKKILDMPLAYDKISVKDHLKAVELASKLTGQSKDEKPQISAFIVNRYDEPIKADIEVKEEKE